MPSILNPSLENTIYSGDGIEGLLSLPKGSVDLILCDLPYGTTQCKWDSVIPFDRLWEAYLHAISDKGAIVLTAAQPFTSALIASNFKNFKYTWVWEKSKATGYLNAKKRPLIAHEDIVVFSKKTPPYYPVMRQGDPYDKGTALRTTGVYGGQSETTVKNETGLRYPRSVVYFKTAESEGKVIHPTQKPVGLFKYLIETYSKEGDLVVDNCVGSGTSAIAAALTGRRFKGWELDQVMAVKAVMRYSDYFKDKIN